MLRTFTWCVNVGATQETELKTNAVQFGDGYEQVSSVGINNVRESWQHSKTGYKNEVDAVYLFLKEHQGVTPFLMTIAGETKTYRTVGAINRAHVGGDAWRVSFTVKQVFAA